MKSIFKRNVDTKIHYAVVYDMYPRLWDYEERNDNRCDVTHSFASNKEEIIFETEKEFPELNAGDNFHIKEIDESVRVIKKEKSSDGSIIYTTDERVVEDGITEITLKYAKRAQEEYMSLAEEARNLKNENETLKSRKWYQMLFKK